MNACEKCGKPCRDTQCLDCRYRSGGKLPDRDHEHGDRDLVEIMVRHSTSHFRAGFTSDQLQQVSPSER